MTDRITLWKAGLAGTLLLTAACGGASMAAGADESAGTSAASEETAGGDYAAEGGETMISQPLGVEDQQAHDGYEDEVTQLMGDFDGAMELASPDCGRAGQLRDAICDLADRICNIAEDNPEHTDVADQCQDGQSRCDSARNRVGDRCPD